VKIYLSGPMTGYDEFNYPAFHACAAELRAMGHEVVSPAEQDQFSGLDPETSEWHEFIRWDLKVLVDCEAIALMDGWHKSRGARLEHHVALTLGMEILTMWELRRARAYPGMRT